LAWLSPVSDTKRKDLLAAPDAAPTAKSNNKAQTEANCLLLLVGNLIHEYGLWAVLFGAMIEGELTLLFAGVLAHYGLFSFGEVFFCGTLGGFVGDSVGYWLGLTSKRTISECAFVKRAQPRMERLSQRFGIYSIFLVKYIYGLRTASAVFWGFVQMRYRRFAPLTAASCMVWVGLLAGIGYFFSGAIELIIGRVQRIGFILLVAFIITLLIAGTVYLIERYWLAQKFPEFGILGLREPKQRGAAPEASPREVAAPRVHQTQVINIKRPPQRSFNSQNFL
jgi:membrane protein DedA with SNARE-associated domain